MPECVNLVLLVQELEVQALLLGLGVSCSLAENLGVALGELAVFFAFLQACFGLLVGFSLGFELSLEFAVLLHCCNIAVNYAIF